MLINPHDGSPLVSPSSKHVFVFNPSTDITLLELTEVMMLVLAAQRFAVTSVDMIGDRTKRHFTLVDIDAEAQAPESEPTA